MCCTGLTTEAAESGGGGGGGGGLGKESADSATCSHFLGSVKIILEAEGVAQWQGLAQLLMM